MTLVNVNNDRTIIVIGKDRDSKIAKAMTFVSENPVVKYANEYDIEDNYSIPSDIGILIEEVDYKPNVDLIRRTMLEYRGQVVLLSSDKKSVPKTIFNKCVVKTAYTKTVDKYLEEIAPNSDDRDSYEQDIFPLVRSYLLSSDRDKVAQVLKLNRPPDVQLMTWLSPNLHPNKITFVDMNVKRKWNSDYFYELLAYSHDGKIYRKMEMPRRGTYSKIPKLLRRFGLKPRDSYLFKNLIQDEEVKKAFKDRCNNDECRLLGLGEKRRLKRYARKPVVQTLDRWF